MHGSNSSCSALSNIKLKFKAASVLGRGDLRKVFGITQHTTTAMDPMICCPAVKSVFTPPEAPRMPLGRVPSEDSRLRLLPAELRSMIYELVVPNKTTFCMNDDGRFYGPPNETLLALKDSCRQLCHETMNLYRSSNTFCFQIRDYRINELIRFLAIKKLGTAYAKDIRDLRLCHTTTRSSE